MAEAVPDRLVKENVVKKDEIEQGEVHECILLTIIYDNGLDERIAALLHDLDLEGWTRLDGVHGFGGAGYKLDTPVWPGANSVLLMALQHEKALEVAAALRALQRTYRRKPGITLWTQPITLL